MHDDITGCMKMTDATSWMMDGLFKCDKLKVHSKLENDIITFLLVHKYTLS